MAEVARLAQGMWEVALRQVTGYDTDLRELCNGKAMIAPSYIQLRKDPWAGSSLLMMGNAGQPAIDRLVQRLNDLARIMPQVQQARFGLMDIDQLRRGASLVEREAGFLTGLRARAAQLVSETSMSAGGEDGEYQRKLAIEMDVLYQTVARQDDSLNAGRRSVPALLEEAAQALGNFGRRMADAFYTASPQLSQIATGFWDAANTSLHEYWLAKGWGPQGPNTRLLRESPDLAEARWRETVAGFSSAGLRGFPDGTPVVTADLMHGWGAFGLALTQRLGKILDVMDETAADALNGLIRSYRTAADALNQQLGMMAVHTDTEGMPRLVPMTQPRIVRMPDATPADGQPVPRLDRPIPLSPAQSWVYVKE
jgi:hypothetical protein